MFYLSLKKETSNRTAKSTKVRNETFFTSTLFSLMFLYIKQCPADIKKVLDYTKQKLIGLSCQTNAHIQADFSLLH